MYYPGPRGFSWLFTACTSELRKSPKALNTRQAGRKKNLWSLWTWISLSCRCQDQDLTLELGLVDFLQTPKSIRLVLRGWWGYLLLHFLHKFLFTSLERICLQNTAVLSFYINIQDSSVFYNDFVSDSAFERIWPWYSRSVFQRLTVSTNIKAKMCSSFCQLEIESQFIIQWNPNFSNRLFHRPPDIRTKSCFPWICFTQGL